MKVGLHSAISGDVIGAIEVTETDTMQAVQADVLSMLKLDAKRHQVELVVPQKDAHAADSACTLKEIIDGGEVSVLIRRASEVELTIESCWKNCHCIECWDGWGAPFWAMDYVRDRFSRLQKITGCSACDIESQADTEDEWSAVRFRGTRAEVELAEGAIKALMANGDSPLFYDDHTEHRLSVSLETLSALNEVLLTSRWGANRRALRPFCPVATRALSSLGSALGVFIQCHGGRRRKKQTVSVAGSAEKVTEAVAALKHLFMYYHNDYLLRGVEHYVEVALPGGMSWAVLSSRVSGAELRHIMNNFGVIVVPPFEHTLNPNVVILGDTTKCQAAHAYISSLLMEASAHVKRCQRLGWSAVEQWGVSDEAYDFWGEEPQEEPWMAPYMYRRT